MADEELLAHEYAIENWESYEEGQSDFEALKQAVLYGLKAGRPEWHDLRIKPDDLPEKGVRVWCCLFNGDYCIARLREDGVWYTADRYAFESVRAWCYLPEFNEETKEGDSDEEVH